MSEFRKIGMLEFKILLNFFRTAFIFGSSREFSKSSIQLNFGDSLFEP